MTRFLAMLLLAACVTLTSAGTVEAKGKALNGTFEGTVFKRTATLISLHYGKGILDQQFVLADNVQITLHGKPAGIFEVVHGDTVRLTVSKGKVTKLEDLR